ncbi:DUF7007 domain-containing protein [Oerskovia sp. NPDC060338]|uniref:DUF7007 domain-containing protein n=1 Tax=Oerskovia sp. NPDC060338 TaxID=3347100 RepID=UPI003651ECF8
MSTQMFDEHQHPRATDGKFATKDVGEAAGGLSALGAAPAPLDQDHAHMAFDEDSDTTSEEAWSRGLDVGLGSRSPWGEIDWVTPVAPGIIRVSTPGHGGVKLSELRNRQIAPALRNASGWYEEDCEAYVPTGTFPRAFAAANGPSSAWSDPDHVREHSWGRVREWMPDQYEKATKHEIAPGQSTVRDRALWLAEHAEDHVTVSARTSVEHPGMVEVTTRLGGQGYDPGAWGQDQRKFLMPADEYERGMSEGHYQVVVDPAQHQDITPPPVVKVPARGYSGLDSEKVASSKLARKALTKPWRLKSGAVTNLDVLIKAGKITGKGTHTSDAGRTQYYLESQEFEGDASRATFAVPKALWEASEAPDEQ